MFGGLRLHEYRRDPQARVQRPMASIRAAAPFYIFVQQQVLTKPHKRSRIAAASFAEKRIDTGGFV